MNFKIAQLAGDGIGPEVMNSAVAVLEAISKLFGHNFEFFPALVGGAAYEKFSEHLPQETINICNSCDSILFGSVGGPVDQQDVPKWKDCERNSILALRKEFQFYANLRPTLVLPSLIDLSPLRKELVEHGIDLLIVRELCGDIYFGEHKQFISNGIRTASDEATYDENQIKKVAYAAFKAAGQRRKSLISVDKANVLETSRLWRKVVSEVGLEYPEIKLEHMLVDNCALQLIKNPAQFDVILTANLFGDILSDEASAIPGSLGLSPSASLSGLSNKSNFGLYEPSGGSAPNIAGLNIANPCAQILSAAMMLRISFGLEKEAYLIENSISQLIAEGIKTKDLYPNLESSLAGISTSKFTESLINKINSSK